MKIIQIMLLLLFLAAQCFANPASSITFPLKQPDGTTIDVRQVGNEWFHVLATADGYILQEDALGFYAYADENGKSSGVYARNARDRSDADKQFLSSVDQNLVYKKLHNDAALERETDAPKFAKSTIQRLPNVNPKYLQGEVRVPVILVQFADVKFKNADPKRKIGLPMVVVLGII